jgi:FAD/FMN-containing dehydrogenase
LKVSEATDFVGDFEKVFGGDLFRPGDDGYERARRIWNADIDRHPAYVARCHSAEQVAEAVSFGRESGLEISVKGGGHNFAGLAVAEGGLMIDLGGLQQTRVDPEALRAWAGGGCELGQLDAAMAEHGVAVTAGVVSHTGVAGLTLGGGTGFLLRKYGLTCDNVTGVTMVLADGSIVRADAEQNPDLFWAIRGGGGNFGIVTEFEYQVHEIGENVQFAMLFFPLSKGAEVIRCYRGLKDKLPRDMAILFAGMDAPGAEAPFVPDEFQGKLGYYINLVSVGSAEEMAAAAETVKAEVEPAFSMVTPMPYLALQSMTNATAPWGSHGYEKGLYLEDLTDEVIEVIERHLPDKVGCFTYISGLLLGGAYGEKDDMDTAWGGPRDAGYQFTITGTTATADELSSDRDWVRRFWDDMRPYAMGSGSYVNNMNEIIDDRVRAAYGDEKYEKLARIKAAYDPQNLFHHNQNIKPAPTVDA